MWLDHLEKNRKMEDILARQCASMLKNVFPCQEMVQAIKHYRYAALIHYTVDHWTA